MQVYVNSISGIDDAIVSMFMSKRSWTRDKEIDIRSVCETVNDRYGHFYPDERNVATSSMKQYNEWLEKLLKWGRNHTTMLRFIDISVTVKGLHRGGQDDWDAHAKRFNNRIIRSSTRMANFGHEMSDWYKDKVIPTDQALEIMGFEAPSEIVVDGVTYIRRVNGYIREGMENDPDVKRGMYMLSIPSNFIFKIDLCELAHVYKERGAHGSANPEVKECAEKLATELQKFQPKFDRQLLLDIKN